MDNDRYTATGELRLAAMVALMARGEDVDFLHRLDDKEEEQSLSKHPLFKWVGNHAMSAEAQGLSLDLNIMIELLENDMNELLDALQNLHTGNERYDRSRRIELLRKHGRIQAPEED